jgi:hypothetical protein
MFAFKCIKENVYRGVYAANVYPKNKQKIFFSVWRMNVYKNNKNILISIYIYIL